MDEKDRIEKVMLKEEMTAAVFANEIGIQGSTLSHILNGRNNPSLDVLKKILNRFRTISSDWLILGIGSMYRAERQSQALTLFDEEDLNSSKSITSGKINAEKTYTDIDNIQQKKTSIIDQVSKTTENPVQNLNSISNANNKIVKKIIVYYSDNTFQEFETK